MAYIGRQLVRGQNRVLDDISSSFNGSTTAFNLTVSSSSSPPASVNQLWIILGGILQKPGTDFTVADAVITFTTAPASTLSFWGMIQGDTSDINSPADASVTPSKIANSGDFAFPADVRFNDADGSHYVGLQAPSTVSSNLVWTLPAADGSANQLLKTDGSGALGWASDASGTALTGSTNNTITTVTGANAIQGEANLTFDGNNLTQTIDADGEGVILDAAGNHKAVITGNTNRSAENNTILAVSGKWNDTEIGRVAFEAGADTTNKDDGHINFYTTPSGGSLTSRLKIDSDGVAHFNGDVKVLTGDVIMGDGRGINFSADANAGGMTSETLDDYEEGAFTPTCEFGSGGNTGMSLGTALGRYTKIGRVVRCDFVINFSAKGTSTGGLYIASLPFTADNDSSARITGIVPYVATVTNVEGQVMAYGGTGVSRVPLYDATNGVAILSQANINDSTQLRGVITYNCS